MSYMTLPNKQTLNKSPSLGDKISKFGIRLYNITSNVKDNCQG